MTAPENSHSQLSMTKTESKGPTISIAFILAFTWLFRLIKRRLLELQQERAQRNRNNELILKCFNQYVRDCNYTTCSLLPNLEEKLKSYSSAVEEITAQLHELSKTKVLMADEKLRKLELWNQLKVVGFARTITAVYVVNILHVFEHIQLSILARMNYVHQVVNEREKIATDLETERFYLTFSWYIINVVSLKLYTRIQSEVEKNLDGISLKTMLPFIKICELIQNVRDAIEIKSWENECFLPKESEEALVLQNGLGSLDSIHLTKHLKGLLNETRDILSHPDFHPTFTNTLNSSFGLFTESLYPHFRKSTSHENNEPSLPLAHNISDVDEIHAFSALIFTAYEEY
ncbi:hypothetical protein ROZALSC1DRAFT_31216 [Rozella allomycis CSF55]|uniref:Peroxin-3 domain-containing protein n=1 Tax=Rozella allomycis (strain CSF55) TaxID=988480 RepID=A0A4P9YCM7_ROZAC|nr:hypothetical protein ROZALSC1DRAFT_31216 [Rozella allomycis CSF55]